MTPVSPSIVAGSTLQFTATCTYSDLSTTNCTSTATWASGTPGTATTGGPIIWSDTIPPLWWYEPPFPLSPDGTLIAGSSGVPGPFSTTNIYKKGQLLTAVPGVGIGWIDDDRLLVNNYTAGEPHEIVYLNCAIYSSAGVKLATPALPDIESFQTLTADSVYSPSWNSLFSLTTGQATWTNPYAGTQLGASAVAGPYVVFQLGSKVVTLTY